MLKIRMQRVGKKNAPKYRVVLIDSQRGPKSSDFIELLGHYDPQQKDLKLEAEQIKDWISKGAQVSDTVYNFLVDKKIVSGPKRQVVPKKVREAEPKKSEETEKGSDDQEVKNDDKEKPSADADDSAMADKPADADDTAVKDKPADSDDTAMAGKAEEPKSEEKEEETEDEKGK